MIILKSAIEIESMRRAGAVVARALAEVERAIKPGVHTIALDRVVEDVIRRAGALPSFKGYQGFPASICASVNDEVIHGIPGQRRLLDGDIIGIDIGACLEGFHGDATVTFPVGEIDQESQRLLDVTREALYRGISKALPGGRLSDISHAVGSFVEENGFSVVREYVGHGIGRAIHEGPDILNYGPPGLGPVLKPGMVFAIEPMVNVGTHAVHSTANHWTVVTDDGKRSAHFEHTVVVTENEPRVLTLL